MRRVALLAVLLLGAACAQLGLRPLGTVAGTPAAAGHDYVVFFDEWSAKLGPAGTKAVAEAAENARAHPGVPILVTGYAANDSGSPSANRLLSRTRAQVVVDELLRVGADTSRIKGAAAGAVGFALDPVEARRVTISVGAT